MSSSVFGAELHAHIQTRSHTHTDTGKDTAEQCSIQPNLD